ncbi:hypothetical protein HMPREF1861_00469 [Corynebacterium kroppenstedtii]|nr:hypothetical protein HMPREF1861_00469 [Corynebacterium kroppenstedtii]
MEINDGVPPDGVDNGTEADCGDKGKVGEGLGAGEMYQSPRRASSPSS